MDERQGGRGGQGKTQANGIRKEGRESGERAEGERRAWRESVSGERECGERERVQNKKRKAVW